MAFATAEIRSKTIPVYVHFDGVTAYKASGGNSEYFCISWSSAVCTGSSVHCKHLLTFLPSFRLIDTTDAWSLGALAKLVIHCMHTLETGAYPTETVDGVKIVSDDPPKTYFDGWRLCWAGFKHDWKAKVMIHRLKGLHYGANSVCECDLASALPGPFNFTAVSPGSMWERTLFTVADHEQQCRDRGVEPSPYIALRGFHMQRSLWDGMHVLFHQGVASDFGGSLALEMCQDPSFSLWLGSTIGQRLHFGFASTSIGRLGNLSRLP